MLKRQDYVYENEFYKIINPTRDIIEKLQSDYKFINLVDWKTCKELIDNMDEK